MIRATILLATALLFFSACNANQESKVITFTPVEYHIYTYKINNLVTDGLRQYVAPEILPDMIQAYEEYKLANKKEPIQAASSAPVVKIVDQAVDTPLQACYNNPDRYNWKKYASAYDWPLDELANVIYVESRNDLCAINPESAAVCWFQDISGNLAFLDPEACMAQGYKKWLAGGRSFEPAWYRWWPKGK